MVLTLANTSFVFLGTFAIFLVAVALVMAEKRLSLNFRI
jgi:hypothetical protein